MYLLFTIFLSQDCYIHFLAPAAKEKDKVAHPEADHIKTYFFGQDLIKLLNCITVRQLYTIKLS